MWRSWRVKTPALRGGVKWRAVGLHWCLWGVFLLILFFLLGSLLNLTHPLNSFLQLAVFESKSHEQFLKASAIEKLHHLSSSSKIPKNLFLWNQRKTREKTSPQNLLYSLSLVSALKRFLVFDPSERLSGTATLVVWQDVSLLGDEDRLNESETSEVALRPGVGFFGGRFDKNVGGEGYFWYIFWFWSVFTVLRYNANSNVFCLFQRSLQNHPRGLLGAAKEGRRDGSLLRNRHVMKPYNLFNPHSQIQTETYNETIPKPEKPLAAHARSIYKLSSKKSNLPCKWCQSKIFPKTLSF